jgi:hypothetical protein
MAYFQVVAVAGGRPEQSSNSIEVSVTDGDTGAPIEKLDSSAFHIHFAAAHPTVSQFKEAHPGIYTMNLDWEYPWYKGFHELAVIVRRTQTAKGGPLPWMRKGTTVTQGQTVCYMAVTPA